MKMTITLIVALTAIGCSTTQERNTELKGQVPGQNGRQSLPGSDINQVASIKATAIPYKRDVSLEERIETYYKKIGAGSRGVTDIAINDSGLGKPLLKLFDDFDNQLPKKIADVCMKRVGTADPFRTLACVSGTSNRFISKYIAYKNARNGFRSVCRDHTGLVMETFRYINIPGFKIGNTSTSRHSINTVTYTIGTVRYKYAFDAGHDTQVLRYFPMNAAARGLSGMPKAGS